MTDETYTTNKQIMHEMFAKNDERIDQTKAYLASSNDSRNFSDEDLLHALISICLDFGTLEQASVGNQVKDLICAEIPKLMRIDHQKIEIAVQIAAKGIKPITNDHSNSIKTIKSRLEIDKINLFLDILEKILEIESSPLGIYQISVMREQLLEA